MPDPLVPTFQKYPDPRRQNLYRLLCDILRDLDLHHPERSQYDPATFERLNALTPEDWPLLARLAEAEGVAPLIYWAVMGSQELHAAFNTQTYTTLKQSYYGTTARNAMLLQELDCLLDELAANGIPVTVLKGPALAATIYPDIALRPFNDLDLLVHPKDLEDALQLVKKLGYQEYYPEMGSGLQKIIGHDVHLRKKDNQNIGVEIHWRLVGGEHDWRSPSMDWFWDQVIECNGYRNVSLKEMLQLSPPANLLYLIAHLVLQHGVAESRLLWFYDLSVIIFFQGNQLDWEILTRRSEEFHWISAFRFGLSVINDLFSIDVPHGFKGFLVSFDDPKGDKFVQDKWFHPQTRTVIALNNLSPLKGLERLRYLLAIIIPSPAHMHWRYHPNPSWLWPLYYPYRWFNIIKNGFLTVRINSWKNVRVNKTK